MQRNATIKTEKMSRIPAWRCKPTCLIYSGRRAHQELAAGVVDGAYRTGQHFVHLMLYLTVGALAFQHHHRLPLKFGVEQSPAARTVADVQMVAILKTTGSERLLAGRKPLIQPHANRPKVNDMLTGLPVEAYNDDLGRECVSCPRFPHSHDSLAHSLAHDQRPLRGPRDR